MSNVRFEMAGITKRFGDFVANADIALKIAPGEIQALLGENGAGKSTLVKIAYGVLAPDQGSMLWNGREVRIDSPRAARALGIGMVFQHFSLFEPLTVLENVTLGLDRPERPSELARRIERVSKAYGLPLDPGRKVADLSTGERQRIEIVRALLAEPSLLIMDEPTSVLTPQEVEILFATLRKIAAEGCSILYISHKLEEVRSLCSAATVLRRGRVVERLDPRQRQAREIAALMVGSDLIDPVRNAAGVEGPVRLELAGLSLPGQGTHGVTLKAIDLEVRGGEILGIAGIAGNGQAELLAALSGERRCPEPEMIRLDGRPVGQDGPTGRRRLGLAYVPEERNGHGAVGAMSLIDNAILGAWQRAGLAARGWLQPKRARAYASAIIERFDVRCSGPDALAGSLSGGNLQKFIMGREIDQQPGVLVVAQPTWGVDAAAAAAIHQALIALAGAGAAILLLSQDLDEVLALADRVAVLSEGSLSQPLERAAADREQLGLLMGGAAMGVESKGAPFVAA